MVFGGEAKNHGWDPRGSYPLSRARGDVTVAPFLVI